MFGTSLTVVSLLDTHPLKLPPAAPIPSHSMVWYVHEHTLHDGPDALSNYFKDENVVLNECNGIRVCGAITEPVSSAQVVFEK